MSETIINLFTKIKDIFVKNMPYNIIIGMLVLILTIFFTALIVRKIIKLFAKTLGPPKKTIPISQIMEKVKVMHGREEFERFVEELMIKDGYNIIASQLKSGKDQGADIIAEKGGERYCVQCKRYKQTIRNDAIQEVIAGMLYHSDNLGIIIKHAVVITTSKEFTRPAKDLAERAERELRRLSRDETRTIRLVGKYSLQNEIIEPVIEHVPEILQKIREEKKRSNASKININKITPR